MRFILILFLCTITAISASESEETSVPSPTKYAVSSSQSEEDDVSTTHENVQPSSEQSQQINKPSPYRDKESELTPSSSQSEEFSETEEEYVTRRRQYTLQVGLAMEEKNLDFLLLFAVQNNNPDMIKNLKRYEQFYIDCTFKQENTALHIAAQNNNAKMIQVLLRLNADSSKQNSNDETPLHVACKKGNLEAVKALAFSSDLRLTDRRGFTPLHTACYHNHLNIVRHLISFKLNGVELQNKENCNVLHTVCAHNFFDFFIEIQQSIGPNIFGYLLTEKNTSGLTPFLLACINGHLNIVHKCLDSCYRDKHPETKSTALHFATEENNVQLATILSKKCFIYAQDNFGYNPLHIAVQNKNVQLVRLFCGYIISGIHDQDFAHRNTPLHLSIMEENNPTFDILLANLNDCDYSVPNIHRQTPFHLALQCKNLHAVQALYCKKIFIGARDNKGNTYLNLAIKGGLNEVASKLLIMGADPNQSNFKYRTPLHYAAKYQNPWVIKLLSQYLLVNVQDNRLNTPLHIACQKNNPIIASQLLPLFKRDYNVTNELKHTALDIVTRNIEKDGYKENALQLQSLLLTHKDLYSQH